MPMGKQYLRIFGNNLQESQNGITHFSEYEEIILCFIIDLNAQNDRVKTKSIIPTDSTSSFVVQVNLH